MRARLGVIASGGTLRSGTGFANAGTLTYLLLFAYGARRIRLSTLGLLQYISPSVQLLLAVLLSAVAYAYNIILMRKQAQVADPYEVALFQNLIVALCLAVLTLQRLLSGWWRKYYLLAAILVLQLAQMAPGIATYLNNGGWSLSNAQRMYWILSLSGQATMYLLVLQLIARVGKESPAHRMLLRGLSVAAVAAAGVLVVLDAAVVREDSRLGSAAGDEAAPPISPPLYCPKRCAEFFFIVSARKT